MYFTSKTKRAIQTKFSKQNNQSLHQSAYYISLDSKNNLLQFFNTLIEIDQRNNINAYHASPSHKGGETNVI